MAQLAGETQARAESTLPGGPKALFSAGMPLVFQLAELLALDPAATATGERSAPLTGVASLEHAAPGDLSFLHNSKYRNQLETTRAGVVIVPRDTARAPSAGQVYVFSDKPSLLLTRLCDRIAASLWPKPAPGIHPSSVIAASAQVDPTAHIGPLCVIEEEAVIGPGCVLAGNLSIGRGAVLGADCWLQHQTVVASYCRLGNRVRLQPGAVIGSDGFGYDTTGGRHLKIPQVGHVVLEDDVEIGANTTVDRARFSETRIGEGTKVDNLVQIAHNVRIGRHCLIVAQVGIAGSSTLGNYVVLGGQAGVAGHLDVGDGVMAAAKTGISKDIAKGKVVGGSHSRELAFELKLEAYRQKLPELFKRVAALEKQVPSA